MKKKIALIVSLSLIGVLLVSVVVMALVRKNYRPELNDPYIITITDTTGEDSVQFFEETNPETYNEVLDRFFACFDQSVLNALFTGAIGGDKVTNHYVQDSTANGTINTYQPLVEGIEGYYLEFDYSTVQTLMYNGREVVDSTNSNRNITYKHVACYIEDSNYYKSMYIFFRGEKGDTTKIFYMTTSARCDAFYSYIEENLF